MASDRWPGLIVGKAAVCSSLNDRLLRAPTSVCSLVRPRPLFSGKRRLWDDREIGRAHSELQSLMRISYAVFCLKKKKDKKCQTTYQTYSEQHDLTIKNIHTIA